LRRTGHDDLGDQVSATLTSAQRGSILEALRERRDLSVADLESDLAISRFGLMKHLACCCTGGREREDQPLVWVRQFDLERLLGVSCQLQLVHVLTDRGGLFANVQAVVPLGRGMTKLQPSEDYVTVCDRQAGPVNGTGAQDADPVPF
jgi:hypothetical protein